MIGNGITAALLGVGSAVAWGAGDFCGGLASKRANAFSVVLASQSIGLALLIVMALASGEVLPPPANLVWCGAAGISAAVGLLALYRALASGRMGVAAPVSGVLCAAIPVAAGALLDSPPRLPQIAGFILALVAVWLVSRTGDAAIRASALAAPIAAGVGFGVFIVIISRASGGTVFWPLVAARVALLTVVAVAATMARQPRIPPRDALPIAALAGIFDAGGGALLVLAAHAGRHDVAAVLSSLYPAPTVVLARLVLGERINRWQLAGLAIALAAIVLITV